MSKDKKNKNTKNKKNDKKSKAKNKKVKKSQEEPEPVYTAHYWPNGSKVTGTAEELRRKGFFPTQFGWTDHIGLTD